MQRNHRAQFYSRLGSTKLREIPRELTGSPQADSLLKTSEPPLTSTPRKKSSNEIIKDEDISQLDLELLDGKT